MSLAEPPAGGVDPAPLAPPAALTCPRCGGGLPAADLIACPACGNPIGSALFAGAPPPLPGQNPQPAQAQAPTPVPGPPNDPVPVGAPDEPASGETPGQTTAETPRETPGATAPPGPARAVPERGPTPAGKRSMMVLDADATALRPMASEPPAPAADFGRCSECGGGYDADGYCTRCGAGRPAPRDHMTEAPAPWLAGVCDRGIRHAENQDAMAVRVDPNHAGRAALVVCDGVTTAMRSAEASLAAADAAAAVLSSSRAQGLGVASAREAALTARLEAAADAAIEAVERVTDAVTRERADAIRGGTGAPDRHGRHGTLDAETGASLPACTIVAAVVEEDLIVVGSVGDSRAYWLPDTTDPALDHVEAGNSASTGPIQLTEDDSYAQEQIRAGMGRAEAEAGPHAHTITRWLGTDAPDHTPASRSLVPAGPGWLLLCSDGLWNYASEPAALAAVVRQIAADGAEREGATSGQTEATTDPLTLAEALVRWAKRQGGHDNITAVLARVGETRRPSPSDDVPAVAATRPEP